jgi:hypothetical protein
MYRSAKLREEPEYDHFGRTTGKHSTRLEMGEKEMDKLTLR